jgi:hypothetical protein
MAWQTGAPATRCLVAPWIEKPSPVVSRHLTPCTEQRRRACNWQSGHGGGARVAAVSGFPCIRHGKLAESVSGKSGWLRRVARSHKATDRGEAMVRFQGLVSAMALCRLLAPGRACPDGRDLGEQAVEPPAADDDGAPQYRGEPDDNGQANRPRISLGSRGEVGFEIGADRFDEGHGAGFRHDATPTDNVSMVNFRLIFCETHRVDISRAVGQREDFRLELGLISFSIPYL